MKKFIWRYFWSIALYGSETINVIGAEVFGEFRNMMLEENEDKMIKLTDREVLAYIEEKRTLLNNILRRKSIVLDVLRRKCLLHDEIE